MRENQKSQFMAFYSTFTMFCERSVVPENAEIAWKLIEPLERTNEQLEQAFADAMSEHTGDFAPKFTAVLERLRGQSPLSSLQARLPKPPSSTQQVQQQPVRLWAMLADANASGPLSEEERAYHKRVLDSVHREPSPPMTPCQFPSCTAPGTISPGTTGGGPWYCRQHFFG